MGVVGRFGEDLEGFSEMSWKISYTFINLYYVFNQDVLVSQCSKILADAVAWLGGGGGSWGGCTW